MHDMRNLKYLNPCYILNYRLLCISLLNHACWETHTHTQTCLWGNNISNHREGSQVLNSQTTMWSDWVFNFPKMKTHPGINPDQLQNHWANLPLFKPVSYLVPLVDFIMIILIFFFSSVLQPGPELRDFTPWPIPLPLNFKQQEFMIDDLWNQCFSADCGPSRLVAPARYAPSVSSVLSKRQDCSRVSIMACLWLLLCVE